MPSFKVALIANNEAGTWASWNDKIAQIKSFYASACELDITLVPTTLTPQFTQYEPGIYEVDPTWYEDNVIPLAAGYDIALFVVPPSDHTEPTIGGYEDGTCDNIWMTTVYSDETSHIYINENGTNVDQGEQAVVNACHELSHTFYALLNKQDNTHEYFYSGQPSKVLADFTFQEIGLYDQLISSLKQLLHMETMNTDLASSQNAETAAPTTQTTTTSNTSFPAKILAWAKIIGQEEGATPALNNPGNLKFTTLTASWGAEQGTAAEDGGHLCQFTSLQDGENALCNFLVLGCEDELVAFHEPASRTLAGFTVVYAGNPPQGYTDAIVNAMGGNPNVQISTFLS